MSILALEAGYVLTTISPQKQLFLVFELGAYAIAYATLDAIPYA
jgi:hypothetical protein